MNFFSRLFNNSRSVLHTPRGDFNLARSADRNRLNSLIIELHRSTEALTKKDIADWRHAWQLAINVDNPDRRRLYDIYRDVDIDSHLTGCVDQRHGFIMARSFKIVNADGEADVEARHFFDQAWFRQLMSLCLDAGLWGHSLIQLGDISTDSDGCISFSDARLIPRKHVIPEFHRLVINEGDDWQSGIDYRDPALSQWIIEAGDPFSLGRYLKAAPHTIPKKNVLAFWDQFAEIFGMPMRIARTTSRNPKEKRDLENLMRDAASNLSIVTSSETDIQFIESGKTDSYKVYDQRIERSNSEISKLIIGQTMTIEDGASLSQSQTHLQILQNLTDADAVSFRDIINNQLIPRMIQFGFPLKGHHFEWDDAIDYTPEQQVAYETMIADRFEVDPQYFADKYNMPVGPRKSVPAFPSGNNHAKQTDASPFFD